MLRSSNPILSKQDSFTPGAPGQQHYDQYQGYGQGPGQEPQGYAQPGFGGPQRPAPQAPTGKGSPGRMTLDDVITKTAVMLGIVIISAAITWLMVPEAIGYPMAIVAGLATIGVTFIVAMRRSVPVPLAIVFAVLEGIFVGVISRTFESFYDGIVVQALFGTLIAAGATLAAYKFGKIRVTGKFMKVVTIATIAFAIAMLLNFGLSFVGVNLGLRAGITGEVSPLAMLVSAIAIVLAVFNLILDFDHVERGIAMRAPANESWRAAFGLTVTLVWLYVEMLRIISYFRR